jgi:hypothetical protein
MLVEERGTDNYREAASILADLRDAIGGEQGNKIARKHAHILLRNIQLSSYLSLRSERKNFWTSPDRN